MVNRVGDIIALEKSRREERLFEILEGGESQISVDDNDAVEALLLSSRENVERLIKTLVGKLNVKESSSLTVSKLGPQKDTYFFDGLSYDYHKAKGCPVCKFPYEQEQTVLKCRSCDYIACSNMRVTDGRETGISLIKREGQTNNLLKATSQVHLYGFRKQVIFSVSGKKWWQKHFYPPQLQKDDKDLLQDNNQDKDNIDSGCTVEEICKKCGGNTATYKLFQARSADEGMSIMFECTTCHNRTVFNN